MSDEQEIYIKAPSIEAVIDLQFVFEDKLSESELSNLKDIYLDDFPELQIIHQASAHFKFGAQNVFDVDSSEVIGYTLRNSNTARVVQIKNNGFTYSHLAPYTNWNNFKDEYFPLLRKYINATSPKAITRTALRYVNKFKFDWPKTLELKDYFNIYPEVPEYTQSLITKFSLKTEIPQPDIDSTAIINFLSGFESNVMFFLLDIDVFSQKNMSVNIEELEAKLIEIRKRKNNIFEKSITDKTREQLR